MIKIRLHGRGGQGAVVASKIIARAAHSSGYNVQVFPQFGVERRGAPVVAFLKLAQTAIRDRSGVRNPDHVMVLDPALLNYIDVTEGLRAGGSLVLNAAQPVGADLVSDRWRIGVVDGTRIAASHGIGTITQPIVNTTMTGAFARVTGLFSFRHLEQALEETLGPLAGPNIAAAREAWDEVIISRPAGLQAVCDRYARV